MKGLTLEEVINEAWDHSDFAVKVIGSVVTRVEVVKELGEIHLYLDPPLRRLADAGPRGKVKAVLPVE